MRRLKSAFRLFLALWNRLEYRLDYLRLPASWLARHKNYVTARYAGEGTLEGAARAAVFVHYDGAGEVHDYVVFYLEALRAAGFQILFVTNREKLLQRAMDRILPLCAEVMCRRNVGYDFGAYRDGLRALGDLSRYDQVLLANDSVYGPLFDLGSLLSECDDRADVWGMSDSWSGRYHLQSFFLLFGKRALASPRFTQFWNDLLLVQSKGWVIRRYEIGFTQTLLRDGLRCTALFAYRTAALEFARAGNAGQFQDATLSEPMHEFFSNMFARVERGSPLNPMHQFWDHMIRTMRCPFIKRELLARNPARIPHVYMWEELIRSVSSYDTDMIVRHLQLATRNRSP